MDTAPGAANRAWSAYDSTFSGVNFASLLVASSFLAFFKRLVIFLDAIVFLRFSNALRYWLGPGGTA